MISFTHKGNFNRTKKYLQDLKAYSLRDIFNKYGKLGVEALRQATPKDTGKTSESWVYEIEEGKGSVSIIWSNTNVVDGWANVAILLQYGHGTRNGGYVEGIDYINPAMRPIFEDLLKMMEGEVSSL